ncbi:MAG: mechanosensitive ion channel family protein [Thermodesulfobacteriota bacterium]
MEHLSLSYEFLGNNLTYWIIGIVVAISLLIILRILKGLLVHHFNILAQKTDTDIDDLIVDLLNKTNFLLLFILSLYVGSYFLALPENIDKIKTGMAFVVILFQIAIWGSGIINYLVKKTFVTKDTFQTTLTQTQTRAIGFFGKFVLWSALFIIALQNLGINVTSLIAGVGIGGIAIALAVQNILGDLFASVSIMLDKPFIVGDFIIVDEHAGSVENIGLKTTRVRSLSGEQLVFSNNDLLSSRIKNYKQMQERRILFTIGVTYDTPSEKLESIPIIIKEIIDKLEKTRFDRAHFKEFGDFSLNFEIVYYMLVPTYIDYVDAQQAINLELYRRFEKEEIEFAYPTQTILLGSNVKNDNIQKNETNIDNEFVSKNLKK